MSDHANIVTVSHVLARACDADDAKTALGRLGFVVTPLAGDASARTYTRISRGATNLMLADYGAQQPRHMVHDLAVQACLRRWRIPVPEVHAFQHASRLICLQDAGPDTLYDHLCADVDEYTLLDRASSCLLNWQALVHDGLLSGVNQPAWPVYDAHEVWREMEVGVDWFIGRYLEAMMPDADALKLRAWCEALVARTPIETLCHRDFHSRNLIMRQEEKTRGHEVIIDYQDAIRGPIVYDWLSLLGDAYWTWPPAIEYKHLNCVYVWLQARHYTCLEWQDFYRQYIDWTVQRLLKVLGVFSRLHLRDGKARYLSDMPRVAARLHRVLLQQQHPLASILLPHLRMLLCKQ